MQKMKEKSINLTNLRLNRRISCNLDCLHHLCTDSLIHKSNYERQKRNQATLKDKKKKRKEKKFKAKAKCQVTWQYTMREGKGQKSQNKKNPEKTRATHYYWPILGNG